jgi:hypothetical protein
MHAAPRGIAGADGGLERSSCQPRIDRAADGIQASVVAFALIEVVPHIAAHEMHERS